MNILILSAGTRNKIVQYFKANLKDAGNVIATDCSKLAPAIYEADKYYIVPRIDDSNYLNVIVDICKIEDVDGVLSLIDPELSLLAKNKNLFDDVGTTIIGSSYDVCEKSLNKMDMFNWLYEHGYYCARSYTDIDVFIQDLENKHIDFPVFVKPICGSASIAISKVYDLDTVKLLFTHSDDLMIQQYLDGQEIGADVYIDMVSNEVVSIFTKKKIKMRAGETDKSVSFIDDDLNKLIEKFVLEFGFKGQIDIDIFDVDGKYYISEVNPRFGGGYPHAYECGCNHIQLIINNLKGIANKPCIESYKEGIYLAKFNEVAIFEI